MEGRPMSSDTAGTYQKAEVRHITEEQVSPTERRLFHLKKLTHVD